MKIPKLCLFCEHFNFTYSEPDLGEYTPGQNVSIYCLKDVWSLSYGDDLTIQLLKAELCKHYTINSWAKERYDIKE